MSQTLMLSLAEYVAALLYHVNCDAELPEKPAEIPWEAVYKFAKSQSLASGIYTAVEPLVKAEAAPELVAAWDRARATDLAQHIKQSSEFTKITAAFTENKINFLPLKGFTYKALWKNPAHRTMSDMDIYFHPDDFPRLDPLLKSMGYAQDHECEVHVNYEKKPFVKIEAHRKFESNGRAPSFDNWTAKSDNPYWHVMDHYQFLLFNAEHAKRHYEKGGCGMRVVFDLYLYMKRFDSEIDVTTLEKTMSENGMLDFFRMLLNLADYWFGGKKPDEELKKTAYFVATGGTYGTQENSISYGVTKKGKLGYILSRVFPSFHHMKNRYPILRKLPFLLPVMYVVRFVVSIFNGRNGTELRGIKRHEKNNKSK